METQVYEQQTWAPAWLVVIRNVLDSDPKVQTTPHFSPGFFFPACKTQHARWQGLAPHFWCRLECGDGQEILIRNTLRPAYRLG